MPALRCRDEKETWCFSQLHNWHRGRQKLKREKHQNVYVCSTFRSQQWQAGIRFTFKRATEPARSAIMTKD